MAGLSTVGKVVSTGSRRQAPSEKSATTAHMLVLFSGPSNFEDVILGEPASLFDTEDTDAKECAIAAAEASPEADDVPLADVKRWLRSWGKPDELPPPPWK